MKVGFPSDRDFKIIVTTGLLKNCPVVPEDIYIANSMFGPSVPVLKGNTVRSQPDRVRLSLLPIPPGLSNLQRQVTLCADVLHVNPIPFLITISEHLGYTTVEALEGVRGNHLLDALRNTKSIYNNRGFTIQFATLDNTFRHLYSEFQ